MKQSLDARLLASTLQKRLIRCALTIFEISKIDSLAYQQTRPFPDTIFQHSSFKMPATRDKPTLNFSRFDCVCVTHQKHPNHLDLHNLWIGIFGFDFPFAELVDNTVNPAVFKADLSKLIMTKIVAHIITEASHTDAANIPGIQTTLEKLKFTPLHNGLHNQRKKFNTDDDFNNACQRIQSKAQKNEQLDITVQLNIAQLHIDFNNFDFLDFAKCSFSTVFPLSLIHI